MGKSHVLLRSGSGGFSLLAFFTCALTFPQPVAAAPPPPDWSSAGSELRAPSPKGGFPQSGTSSCPAAQPRASARSGSVKGQRHYELSIDGVAVMRVQEVTFETGAVLLKYGPNGKDPLAGWVADSAAGKAGKRDVSIAEIDYAGLVTGNVDMIGARPTKYVVPALASNANQTAVARLTLAYDSLRCG